MRKSLQTFTATALALACGHVMAHPSMFTGSHKFTVFQNTAAGPNQATDRTPNNGNRGYVDGFRIGHGVELSANETGATAKWDASGNLTGKYEKPIAYTSVIFPAGEGVVYRRDASGNIRKRRDASGNLVDWVVDDGRAPWSTSSTGSDPTIGYRPAVARITNMANDGRDATKQVDASGNVTNTEAYIGTATTLASEMEFEDASGNWVPLTSLRGFITVLGNAGYYRSTSANTKIDGFVNKNPRIDASGNYLGVDYKSASFPGFFATAYHVAGGGSGANGNKALNNLRFKSGSCARRLVIRPGAVDVASYDATGTNFNSGLPGEEHINTWMGGRTAKWKVGDAGQQNNWSASFTMLNNAAGNTAGGFTGCTDANNGDYDLVVMPTHYELDTFLPTSLVRGTANPGTL